MKTIMIIICGWFMTISAFAQSGYYMQYSVSGTDGKQMQMTGSMAMYLKGNNSRTEMNMNIPGMGAMKQVYLCRQSTPNIVYMINDADKSFSEVTTMTNGGKSTTEVVSVIGQEKIGSYNCTHVKVKQEGKINDMWVSKDVTGYASMSVKNEFMKSDELNAALKAKNVEGFPVKFTSTDDGMTMTMVLTEVVAKTIGDDLFQIPAGYTKKANAMMMPGGQSVPDMQKLQNMTEEEREKYLEQMRKQMGVKED